LVQGIKQEEIKNKYDEHVVFERFRELMKSEIDNPDEFETEESKKAKFPNHGLQLWGIGYVSSDYVEDNDTDDEDEEDDFSYLEDLRNKIMTSVDKIDDLSMDEYETLTSDTRLREIYSYRWWRDTDDDNYVVLINKSQTPIKTGEQIFYNYGKRTNLHLF